MSHSLRCVLLVDDDPAANFLHRLAIEASGRVEQVVAVTSGAEAIQYLEACQQQAQSAPPDLLLLDLNMPGMSGWQFLDTCAKQELPLPPVVSILTTSENPDDRQRADQHPAVADFLTKFMEAADFEALLQRHALALARE
ncbi:MAG: response regulator [Oceanococcaceae bacterium]